MVQNDSDSLNRGKQVGKPIVLMHLKISIKKILVAEMGVKEEPATFVSKVLLVDWIIYPYIGSLGGHCAEVMTIGLAREGPSELSLLV